MRRSGLFGTMRAIPVSGSRSIRIRSSLTLTPFCVTGWNGYVSATVGCFGSEERPWPVRFRLDGEQLALQEAVAAFCASRYSLDTLGEHEAVAVEPAAWQELAELGVFSLLVPEHDGGLGLGAVAAAVVFEQLGAALVPGPLLWSTLGATVLPRDPGKARIVGGCDIDDDGDEALVVEYAADLDALVLLRGDGVFALERSDLPEPAPLEPLDPLTTVGAFAALPAGKRVGEAAEADRMRAEGVVLTAALLLGISDTALTIARDYSLEREQFGRPIGSFQALKHMMADMFVRTALARSATYAAAAVLDEPAAGDLGRSIGAAKLLAGEAAIENARAAVQVLGGMGFTWDMPPHYLLKRAWVLEHGFGTSTSHALAISSSLARG